MRTTVGIRNFVGSVLAVLTMVAVGLVAMPGASAFSVTPRRCVVSRPAARASYTSLAAAVVAAASGETIIVRGTCLGATHIGASGVPAKNLTITGRLSLLGFPTLDGTGVDGTILDVESGSAVTLNFLTITHGTRGAVGVIGDPTLGQSEVPTLVLNAVNITRNQIAYPEPYYNAGGGMRISGAHVFLNAGTRITRNQAVDGGGIYTDGTAQVTLNPGASVTHNSAQHAGGGIFLCECYGYTGGMTFAGGVLAHNQAPLGPDFYDYVFDPDA